MEDDATDTKGSILVSVVESYLWGVAHGQVRAVQDGDFGARTVQGKARETGLQIWAFGFFAGAINHGIVEDWAAMLHREFLDQQNVNLFSLEEIEDGSAFAYVEIGVPESTDI